MVEDHYQRDKAMTPNPTAILKYTEKQMDKILTSIQEKKTLLDRLQPMLADTLAHLQKYYDVELTYTSNAIEGNTLTHRETAEVIEHGITVGGKSKPEKCWKMDAYRRFCPSSYIMASSAGQQPKMSMT